MPKQKVFRTGNSLAVTIPAHLVSELGIRPGDSVEVVSRAGESRMMCVFTGSGQLILGKGFLGKRVRAKGG